MHLNHTLILLTYITFLTSSCSTNHLHIEKDNHLRLKRTNQASTFTDESKHAHQNQSSTTWFHKFICCASSCKGLKKCKSSSNQHVENNLSLEMPIFPSTLSDSRYEHTLSQPSSLVFYKDFNYQATSAPLQNMSSFFLTHPKSYTPQRSSIPQQHIFSRNRVLFL